MNIKANKKLDFDDCKNPGDFYIVKGDKEPYRLSFLCPCGCGVLAGIRIASTQTPEAWFWDGNETEPTTTPSINILKSEKESHWHGYLTNGEFKSC